MSYLMGFLWIYRRRWWQKRSMGFKFVLLILLKCGINLSPWKANSKQNWAASWQNQQNDCAPSEDSDQPGHPPSLMRVFAVRSIGSKGPKCSSCGQRRLWSDGADAQADLSLRWAHSHFVGVVISWLNCEHWSVLFVTICNAKPTNNGQTFIWTSSRENLSSGFPTSWLKPACSATETSNFGLSKYRYYTI